jgi:gamma-glutamyltranspeptidase/glutathione hydrolase
MNLRFWNPERARHSRKGMPAALLPALALALPLTASFAGAESAAIRARQGMVVSQSAIASEVGAQILRDGGNAVDAAVATAFALAVTHPTAGNIGGGGFLVWRPASGEPLAYDFREKAPAAAHPEMWLDENGEYSFQIHHLSHKAVGVPGTVAGLRLAWEEQGSMPWESLVRPAVELARGGFRISHGLAGSLARVLERMAPYPASVAQFSKEGTPYAPGEILRQPDLAASLDRILESGSAGFYEGETAELLAAEMAANGGLITLEDLKNYRAVVREPIRGEYRGYEIISMPPPSSGGTAMVQMLNILEGYDIAGNGFGSAANMHLMAEAMRRAYSDRALHLGDPDFNPGIPIARLTSKDYAEDLRATIDPERASVSSPSSFEWTTESGETTHFSVVDKDRNAVSLTYTLEFGYGSGIVVPGAGFLLNNEMDDFAASPGQPNQFGLVEGENNAIVPGKRMLSSMTPSIVLDPEGALKMVVGTPGGPTIITTVYHVVSNVIDHGMGLQQAVESPRVHHQAWPDQVFYEEGGLAAETLDGLAARGHELFERGLSGDVSAILVEGSSLLGVADPRRGGGASASRGDAPGDAD